MIPKKSIITLFCTTLFFNALFAMEMPKTAQQQELLNAMWFDNTARAESLLRSGVNPNFSTGTSFSPLAIAISHLNAPAIQMLLAHGANPNEIIDLGRGQYQPIIFTVFNSSVQRAPEAALNKVFSILMADPRFDVNNRSSEGETLLMRAVFYNNKSLINVNSI